MCSWARAMSTSARADSEACPICGSTEISHESEVSDQAGNPVVVVWCGDCNMARRDVGADRADYHATENEITYSDEWARAKELDLALPGYESTWRDRFEFSLGDAANTGQSRPRVLEVGCGIGHNLAAYRRFGCDVVGVEPSAAAARFARERFGLEVHEAYLEDADLEPSSFDLVVIDNVLEHLPDPISALRVIKELLAENGRVFVDVPNLGAWEGRVLRNRWAIYEEGHINFFAPATLERTLTEAGLEVREITTYEALVTWGMVLEQVGIRALKKALGNRSGAPPADLEWASDARANLPANPPANQPANLRPSRRRQVESALWIATGVALKPLRRIQCRKGGGQNIWALAERT